MKRIDVVSRTVSISSDKVFTSPALQSGLQINLLVLLERTETRQSEFYSSGMFQEGLTANFPGHEIRYSWEISE